MFLPPVALNDLAMVASSALMAQLRQLPGSRSPPTVASMMSIGLAGMLLDVLELHVHLGQRLLHMLDMVGRVFHQHRSLAQVATQGRISPSGRKAPDSSP